jgi:hypothetical protein
MTTRTAIIFRTHFWDDFAQRQFDRLLARAGTSDVFVLVDETSRPVVVPHDKVVRVTAAGLLAMGFADAGEGNLLWFNGDYPLYRFLELHGDYDYYLQLEYDVAINTDVDALIAAAAADRVDYIGLTKGEATPDWPWLKTCTDAYAIGDIQHQLICLALFSARALRHLWARRLALSAAYARGDIKAWPMCEGFIATELAKTGMNCRELSHYGDTACYDHWPPYLEADIGKLDAQSFVHPVLDDDRYIGSLLKYHVGLAGYLNPRSLFHRKLRRLSTARYVRALRQSFASKAARTMRSAGTRLTQRKA